jgi:RNA polymerase sigma-70 factor, ECF subfamily
LSDLSPTTAAQAGSDGPAEPNAAGLLLPLVAAGDRAAINRCIRRYGPLIWAIARRLSPGQLDAEDAVQEIFLDVWRNAARFDAAKGSEKVFITVLARRRLIDRLRSARARLAAELPMGEDMDFQAAAGSHAERDTEVEEARKVLKALPEEQQRVITLSLVHGMSHGEIAGRVGLPLGTVKTMIRRGVLRVRSMLASPRRNPTSLVRQR